MYALAQPQFDAGLADPAERMERMVLLLSLRPGAEVDLDFLIKQQHDPYSALYHQWLTPDQFGAAFGMSDADLNTIVWWLQQHGFTIDEVARGRRWINFTGSVGQVLTLTIDNGTQFTSARFVDMLSRPGISHRRTAFNHPEGNGLIERFHRSLKEEEIWLNE